MLALQAIVGSAAGCSEVGAGGGTLWRRISTAFLAALLSVAVTAFWIVETAFGYPLDRMQPLRDEPAQWPQLLLYSDVDPLVLPQVGRQSLNFLAVEKVAVGLAGRLRLMGQDLHDQNLTLSLTL